MGNDGDVPSRYRGLVSQKAGLTDAQLNYISGSREIKGVVPKMIQIDTLNRIGSMTEWSKKSLRETGRLSGGVGDRK